MKLQLDTTNKTIKVEENVKVSELIKLLKQILPNDYLDFTLETHTSIVNWHTPYIIDREKPYIPWTSPWMCNSTSDNLEKVEMMSSKGITQEYELKPGLYNIEI